MKSLISELPFLFLVFIFLAFIGGPFVVIGLIPECAIELIRLGAANGIVFIAGIVLLTIAQEK